MGKGAAKFGFKSGTLPAVRDIFKKPIKPVIRPANPNVGYSEGIKEPKGVQRQQPSPEIKTVQQLIKDSAKQPKVIPNLAKLNEHQREKISKATLRREYFQNSLKNEESRLEKLAQKKAQALESSSKKEHDDLFRTTESTELALPTIDKYLQGPIMRQRTAQEQDLLQAKRAANRMNHELIGQTNKASKLLALYYSTKEFILTEEELEQRINDAFAGKSPHHSVKETNATLITDALFNTVNAHPGLQQIEDGINGRDLLFKEQLKKLAEVERIEKEKALGI
ncbi:hypothetical protein WICPIJ_004730 [Wickerhamomyces pijperi]|uniref:37S ribosomal protein PET123, mitochondrial n=1 Tax=Wickerhamomyces pijperi TaxID=599730 RepID=A0A9P8TML9_WICPI|nr:hypothetical protein WICPIJ_004730 [Wickerhamomyces pijperi]